MIREITKADFEHFWPTFFEVIQAQETYAFEPDMTFEQGYNLWCELPRKTFVFEQEGQILGSYYISPLAVVTGKHSLSANPNSSNTALLSLHFHRIFDLWKLLN